MSGYLQSNAAPESESGGGKKSMMTALLGSTSGGGTKKWRKDYWSFDGEILEQRSGAESDATVYEKYTVIGQLTKTSKQVDLNVRTHSGKMFKLSLKASTGAELKPWCEALRGKKLQAQTEEFSTPIAAKKKKISNDPLEKLEDLRKQYNDILQQMDIVDRRALDEHETIESKLEAKSQVAQMNGRLDKLQFAGVDSVVTSEIQNEELKARAKLIRKTLNADIEHLRARIGQVHAHLSTISPRTPKPAEADHCHQEMEHDALEKRNKLTQPGRDSPQEEQRQEETQQNRDHDLDNHQQRDSSRPSDNLVSAAASAVANMTNSPEQQEVKVAHASHD